MSLIICIPFRGGHFLNMPCFDIYLAGAKEGLVAMRAYHLKIKKPGLGKDSEKISSGSQRK